VEYVKQTAGFARHIIEEVTKNVSTHLIENLNSFTDRGISEADRKLHHNCHR
jgi:hypothetical protein